MNLDKNRENIHEIFRLKILSLFERKLSSKNIYDFFRTLGVINLRSNRESDFPAQLGPIGNFLFASCFHRINTERKMHATKGETTNHVQPTAASLNFNQVEEQQLSLNKRV